MVCMLVQFLREAWDCEHTGMSTHAGREAGGERREEEGQEQEGGGMGVLGREREHPSIHIALLAQVFSLPEYQCHQGACAYICTRLSAHTWTCACNQPLCLQSDHMQYVHSAPQPRYAEICLSAMQ